MSTPPPPTSLPRLWLSGQSGSDAAAPDTEQFDALTDLFLGEVSRSPPRRSVNGCAATNPLTEGGTGPRLRLTGLEAPETEAAPTTPRTPSTNGRVAAEQQTSVPPAKARIGPAFVECLMVGNLPVLASAWASQYVREIAEVGGRAVASVRLQAGYVSVDLVNSGALDVQPARDVESALRSAASVTDRWVVRVDSADESAVAGRAVVRLVTLLTGADESARVSAYGSIKALASRLPGPGGEAGADKRVPPVIRVAIMSAEREGASAAAARIVETVKQKLGREIQHAVCSAKIRATNPPAILFNGQTELNATALIDLLERVTGAESGADVGIWTSQRPIQTDTVERRWTEPAIIAEPQVESVAADLIGADNAVATVVESEATAIENAKVPETGAACAATPKLADPARISSHSQVAGIDDVRLWASAAATAARPATQQPQIVQLASHIAGHTPLALHCPYATDVEFGLDAQSGLHLLARGQGDDDEGVLGRLMAACAWVDAHRALIAAAVGVPMKAEKPVLHLFTSQPRRARRLLETDVRVHLLAPVAVGEAIGWYCTELN